MSIPRYDEIQLPALQYLSDGKPKRSREMELPLARKFNLSEDEINQMYESGNGPIFIDRLNWALSYLNMAGVVQKPKRGIYQINSIGLDLLKTPEKFKKFINKQLESREPTRRKKKVSKLSIEANTDLTPEESLYTSFQGIKKSVYTEIIDTILSKSPRTPN